MPSTLNLTRTRIFLAAAFLLLFPFCLLGYGSDNDTYTVLDAGRSTWVFHTPDTSRHPGYWLYEAITFVLSSIGGSTLVNLVTLAVALTVLYRFLVLAARLGVRFPFLVAASLAVTPVFVFAATSTDDYLWSLLGIVLTTEILLAPDRRLTAAILPAAFAFAIRGTNGIVLAGLIGGAIFAELRNHRGPTPRAYRLFFLGLAAAFLGGLPYIESWRVAHHTFSFLQAFMGPDDMWSLHMHLGRFVYKSLYLLGPVATLILVLTCFIHRPLAPTSPPPDILAFRNRAIPVFVGAILANTLLFLAWPIEISYLLPGAFFLLLLLGFTLLARSPNLALAFLAAVFSLNLVTPQLAQPNFRGRATAASFHPAFRPGLTLGDVRLRLLLRHCEDYDCYIERYPGH